MLNISNYREREKERERERERERMYKHISKNLFVEIRKIYFFKINYENVNNK